MREVLFEIIPLVELWALKSPQTTYESERHGMSAVMPDEVVLCKGGIYTERNVIEKYCS